MAYRYKHFIPENTSPKGAKSIGVYRNNKKIADVPLGRMTPPTTSKKLYSFGLVSDMHITMSNERNRGDFAKAMSLFDENGCAFCCNAGDITNVGFRAEGDANTLFTDQFTEYKRICDLYPTLPVYEICGNHESYVVAITNNLPELETYTGQGNIAYTMTHGDDVYIFVGQSTAGLPMSYDHMQWLYEQLEENRNKRTFVFFHSFLNDDSGNPCDIRDNSLFANFTSTRLSVFKSMCAHYKNAIFLHGHSHMKFESQEYDECANYTEKNGFRSVHIPSCAMPRTLIKVVDETTNEVTWDWEDDSKKENESYGYIVDVYADCIVLNGMDFANEQYVPLGVYKIDTELVEIPEKTFTDGNGIITT